MDTTSPSRTLVVARVLLALIFLAAGADKLVRYADTGAYMASMGVSAWLLPLVIALELGAGLAIVLGYRTRVAAWLLTAFSLAAAAIFHHDFGNTVQATLFMKNLALAGGLLALAVAGPGAISLDARVARA